MNPDLDLDLELGAWTWNLDGKEGKKPRLQALKSKLDRRRQKVKFPTPIGS